MNRKEALKILGFNPSDNPSEREITTVYRKLALKYHPDKHSDKSKDAQKQNEEKFKELSNAYKFLAEKNAKEAKKPKETKKTTKPTSEGLNEFNLLKI